MEIDAQMKRFLLLAAACLCLPLATQAQEPLYPAGDLFPIGGYIPSPERDHAAGFTLAGPSYGKQNADETLARCEAVGMPLIYPVGFSKRELRGDTPPTETEIRERIAAQVRRVAHHTLIYAWYLTPEELRYWRPNELAYLRIASETIREADPHKRPVWMYEPGHRTRETLARTFPYLQIAGKGVYTNYSSRRNERVWVRWTLDQQNRAVAEANPGMLVFAVPEMFRQPEPESLSNIRQWVRHDCYAALLEGAQGIVIFSFGRRSGFPARGAYYNAYAEVARQLTGPLKLGTVFLRGKAAAVPGFQTVSGPERAGFTTRGKSAQSIELPSLKVKTFAWQGAVYHFAVNSSPETVTIRFDEPRHGKPLLEGQPPLADDQRTLALGAWEVAAYREPIP